MTYLVKSNPNAPVVRPSDTTIFAYICAHRWPAEWFDIYPPEVLAGRLWADSGVSPEEGVDIIKTVCRKRFGGR